MRKKWTNEEIEFLKNNYSELGLKECSEKLNRKRNSVLKKARTLDLKTNYKPSISKEKLQEAVDNSYSLRDVFNYLGNAISGAGYKFLRKHIEYYDIDISHFDPYKKNKERIKNGEVFIGYSLDYWLQEGTDISSSKLKEKLYKHNLKEPICEFCGQDEYWQGKKISLILDHIDGDRKNNEYNNLRILCPNCNATLETHCGKNKGKKFELDKQRERNGGLTDKELEDKKKNRKVERPPYEQLIRDINELGYLQTGKKYGVSDNAVRKWKRWYENYENVG